MTSALLKGLIPTILPIFLGFWFLVRNEKSNIFPREKREKFEEFPNPIFRYMYLYFSGLKELLNGFLCKTHWKINNICEEKSENDFLHIKEALDNVRKSLFGSFFLKIANSGWKYHQFRQIFSSFSSFFSVCFPREKFLAIKFLDSSFLTRK